MKHLSRIMGVALIVVVVGVIVFLTNWDIPAPMAPVEMTLPDDRFPK